MKYIASSGGLSSTIMAKKHGITNSTTDYYEMLKDSEVDLVFITTQHNMHAKMTLDAMKAGKNVFVEKPLALTHEDLDQIIEIHQLNYINVSII